MKSSTLLTAIILIVLATASCEKPESHTNATAGIEGKWNSMSYRYQRYQNDTLVRDTTLLPPFAGLGDVVEYVVFKNDSLWFKIGNEDDENVAGPCKIEKNIVLAGKNGNLDTMMFIDALTATRFDYNFYEQKSGGVRIAHIYRSKRE
jgi:hypothetical protein